MTPKEARNERLAQHLVRHLERRNMAACYCPTAAEAVKKVSELIPDGSSVTWGGSMTMEEIGLIQTVKDKNYDAIDRMQGDKKEQATKIFNADWFLMSANAITLDGELINIDGTANRICYLCFGPEHVLVIAGMNKVVTDVPSGIARVRNMATPPNTTRLHKDTPCARFGRCMNCLEPDCICNQILVTRRSGQTGRIHVILVGEELGY